MKSKKQILIVDDDAQIRDIMSRIMVHSGYRTLEAESGESALELMQERKPDLAFIDIYMEGMTGLDVIKHMKELNLDIPVITMTGYSSMDLAIEAIRIGAYEYISKPMNMNSVITLVNKCFEERSKQSSEKRALEYNTYKNTRYEIIGSSEAMVEVYKSIGAISRTKNPTNVLVLGESGTGKELVSQQIHNWSEHTSGPFIPINITALPDTLIESELFGYEKGAFTGANQQNKGKFEEAGEGTIFLDEIGTLSLNLQKKILRILQEREFYRLGGTEVVPVKCRIIAATNDDLISLIQAGEFRNDLYYRLKVVTINLPSLRQRRDDIPHLSEYFIQKHSHELGIEPPLLTQNVIDQLCEYPWPGNVRELSNMITQALIFKHGDLLSMSDFPDLASDKDDEVEVPFCSDLNLSLEHARKINNEEFEKRYITSILRKSHGNVAEAAKSAEISPQRCYQLIKKYGIKTADLNHA